MYDVIGITLIMLRVIAGDLSEWQYSTHVKVTGWLTKEAND